MKPTDGFIRAGEINYAELNLAPGALPPERTRHEYGHIPFAKVIMPTLLQSPGVYL